MFNYFLLSVNELNYACWSFPLQLLRRDYPLQQCNCIFLPSTWRMHKTRRRGSFTKKNEIERKTLADQNPAHQASHPIPGYAHSREPSVSRPTHFCKCRQFFIVACHGDHIFSSRLFLGPTEPRECRCLWLKLFCVGWSLLIIVLLPYTLFTPC